MGLDGLELAFELEDHFRINLREADWAGVRTVADLAAVVIACLPKSSGRCVTAQSFYRLRDLLMTETGLPKRSIRPSSELEDVLPGRERRRWGRLRTHDQRIPRLVPPPLADRILLWSGALLLCSWFTASAMLYGRRGFVTTAGLSLPILIIGVMAYAQIYSFFRSRFPSPLKTIGDVARFISPAPVIPSSPGGKLATEQKVLQEVIRITAETFGIAHEKVHAESDLTKDLRLIL